MSIFNELKRRNVFRVGIAYIVAAWLIAQVLQLVFESFGTPDWVMKTVLVLLATGLPLALFFAWAFEMTPEGLKRESEVDRSQSITAQTGQKLNSAIFIVLVLALAYFIVDKFVLSVSREAAIYDAAKQEMTEQAVVDPQIAAEPDNSIAVLPFVNMSGDQENEYFSDGLTEELLNALARINGLKVTGRTSSFAFKGQNTDLREIGQTLGVAHILEGSVRKAQNRVRITAQLIKAEDGYHMWSDTFDRDLDDIFAIQEEIATRVANELSTTLLGETPGQVVHQGTRNAQAYEAYLRGRYLLLRSPDDLQVQNEADQLFQQALDLDPQFTLALYGKFIVLSFKHRNGLVDYQQGTAQLREIADRIVAMDPELPQGYVALGRVAMLERRWQESEAAMQQALRLNPGEIDALNGLSRLMSDLKRNDEQQQYALEALARDPLDLTTLLSVVSSYALQGQCVEAGEVAMRALDLAPETGRFHALLGDCWQIHHGESEKALELYKQEPVRFLKFTGLAIAYNKLGDQQQAQDALDELIAAYGDQAATQQAQLYAQWGETEKALDAIELAYQIRDTGFALIYSDKKLDPIRTHPRFLALLEKWWTPETG